MEHMEHSGRMDLTNTQRCLSRPDAIAFLKKFIRDCLTAVFRERLISLRQWGGAGSRRCLLLTHLSWEKVLGRDASLLEWSGDIPALARWDISSNSYPVHYVVKYMTYRESIWLDECRNRNHSVWNRYFDIGNIFSILYFMSLRKHVKTFQQLNTLKTKALNFPLPLSLDPSCIFAHLDMMTISAVLRDWIDFAFWVLSS